MNALFSCFNRLRLILFFLVRYSLPGIIFIFSISFYLLLQIGCVTVIDGFVCFYFTIYWLNDHSFCHWLFWLSCNKVNLIFLIALKGNIYCFPSISSLLFKKEYSKTFLNVYQNNSSWKFQNLLKVWWRKKSIPHLLRYFINVIKHLKKCTKNIYTHINIYINIYIYIYIWINFREWKYNHKSTNERNLFC